MNQSPSLEPELSFVLLTDTRDTIRGVLRRLHLQTAKARMEVVVVVPPGRAREFTEADAQGFANFIVVESDPFVPAQLAKARGIRSASAPLVFLGETHAFPHRGWAEAIIAANRRGRWGAISPAFGNSNPRRTLSWAALLADYGEWLEGKPAGEIDAAPLFNTAYNRAALLELGVNLEAALGRSEELPATLQARGYRSYFAAQARIDHMNLIHVPQWLHENFLTGLLVSGNRARRWLWARRIAYVIGSPLIPFVLTRRALPGVRRARRMYPISAGVYPLLFIGTVARSVGEMIGYAVGLIAKAEESIEDYELHKVAYAARR